jgi:hypothetical protein
MEANIDIQATTITRMEYFIQYNFSEEILVGNPVFMALKSAGDITSKPVI